MRALRLRGLLCARQNSFFPTTTPSVTWTFVHWLTTSIIRETSRMKSLTATFVMLLMLFGFMIGFSYAIVLPTALIIFLVFHGGASEINGIIIFIESLFGLVISGAVFDWFL